MSFKVLQGNAFGYRLIQKGEDVYEQIRKKKGDALASH